METSRIATLSEGQLLCLRLVAQHRTSKEIARELGISEDTVDQRIASARRKLGAQSRAEAARILTAAERPDIYGQPVYPSSDLPPAPKIAPSAALEDYEERQASVGVVEDREVYQPSFPFRPTPEPVQFPMPGRRWNDLGPLMRTAVIIAIAAASILLPLIAVSTYETASRILKPAPSPSARPD